jgi:hypothetical protein
MAIAKEPIIESFRKWLEIGLESFNQAEVKIMLNRISYLEGIYDESEADKELMLRKFNEDLENACESYRIRLERQIRKEFME